MMATQKKPGRQIVTLSIPADVCERLDAVAGVRGMSRSKLVQTFIADGLGQEEAVVNVLTNPLLIDFFRKAFTTPGIVKQMAKAVGEEVDAGQLKLFGEMMDAASDAAQHTVMKQAKKQAKKTRKKQD